MDLSGPGVRHAELNNWIFSKSGNSFSASGARAVQRADI